MKQQEQKVRGHFFAFGTYGTLENRVRNQMNTLAPEEKNPSGRTKIQYIVRRLFPDMEVFKAYYPFFYRHQWLMPIGYVYRWVYKGITNFKNLKKEVDTIRTI